VTTEADPGGIYPGSRALVLGASGFIGRWVARRLSQAQATVTVAVRDLSAYEGVAQAWGIRAQAIELDSLDAASVERAIHETTPDIVFNLVGYGVDRGEVDTDLMWRINRDLVRHTATALSRTVPSKTWSGGRRLVHVGSALEYGLMEGVAREDRPPVAHTEYGRSKLEGTAVLAEVAAATGLNAVTGRLFTVYGPGEHPGRLLPTIRRAAIDGTVVRLTSGTQCRDFSYVDDVAEGLIRLGASFGVPGEAINVAAGRMTSVRDFAQTAAQVLHLPVDRLQFGAEEVRPDEMRISGVAVDRLKARTGWEMAAGLENGLSRAARFEDELAGDLPQQS